MQDPVKHGLFGVLLFAGALIFIPALLEMALYVLAIIGLLAIARMLVRTFNTPAKKTDDPDTPGRPR